MKPYCLTHLSDTTLERDMLTLDKQHKNTLAVLLAHLAEYDARRLYLPSAFPSMFAYCVTRLRWCEQAAFKRIRAARTARRFPAVFSAVADGRLHLSAVVLLSPYLNAENVGDLLAAATNKSKSEIERLIAERFPRLDVPELISGVGSPSMQLANHQLSPGTVGASLPSKPPDPNELAEATEQVAPPTPCPREVPGPRTRVEPLAPQRYALQLTMSQGLHDKLRHAQQLLSHQVPSGEVAQVLERALDALIHKLEKRKFAEARTPRQGQSSPVSGRHIPAHVRRAVWNRDGGQCTFVSERGERCPARKLLEFDHIDPVARGGRTTVAGMRLRCRAHNQYEAERVFGVEFMKHKRQQRAAVSQLP